MKDSVRQFLESHFSVPMAWPLALAGALFATLLLTVAYRAFFRWLAKLAKLSETDLDDLFLKRMRLPAKGLVVLLSAHVFVVLQQIENATVSKVVAITELLLISYLVIEALETAVLDYWLRERKKVELPAVVRHLVLVIVYSVAVLSVIGAVTGVNLAPVIATSTVITVVLGLALQDTLGNLFSGLALSLEKPFADGDWILVDGIEGLVVHMGWRATHIRTFSWDVVIIPNSVIAKARVQNFSAPDKVTARNLEFPVALHATPREVEEAARAACKGVPEVQTDPPPKIWLVALTPLFARYIVKFWVPDFKIHDDVESDLLKALSEELKRCSISLSPSGVGIDAESRVVARPGGRE